MIGQSDDFIHPNPPDCPNSERFDPFRLSLFTYIFKCQKKLTLLRMAKNKALEFLVFHKLNFAGLFCACLHLTITVSKPSDVGWITN
jgi:hypothetical protein